MDVRRTLAVLLVGACVLASGAHAQGMRWLRGREGLGLTAADVEIQRATIRKTLDEEPDGGRGTWDNPDTGHSGEVLPLRTFAHEGQRCRVFVLIMRGAETRDLEFRACKQPDGEWRIPAAG